MSNARDKSKRKRSRDKRSRPPPLELSAEAMLAIDSLINIVGRCLCIPYQVARDMTIRVCDARHSKKEDPE